MRQRGQMVQETVADIMTIDGLCCISCLSPDPRESNELEMQQSSGSFKLLVHNGNAPAEYQLSFKLLSLNRLNKICG